MRGVTFYVQGLDKEMYPHDTELANRALDDVASWAGLNPSAYLDAIRYRGVAVFKDLS